MVPWLIIIVASLIVILGIVMVVISYKNKGKAVKKNFVYNSLNNKKFLTISQLKKEIKKMGFNI